MSRIPPQAPPPCDSNDEESEQEDSSSEPPGDSNNEESEQEDVSSEPKQKVQKGIMTFFNKKPKNCGRGCPRKETAPLQPLAKKQKDGEAGKPAKKQNVGDAKKYPKYHSDPEAAAALKEAASYYNETGKYVTLKDGMLSNKPLVSIPRSTVCFAAKAIQQSDLTNDAKPSA